MAKIRRVVRKVDPAELHTFDEQLWPVNVALLVMAGFVTGVIIALSSFRDTRIFYNGWFHLATLAVTVGLLIWLASKLDNQRLRRGLQLAAVLSLLIHMLLMVVLYNRRLQYLARQEEGSEEQSPLDEQIVTLPDYHIQAPEDQQRETFERPVDVETPDDATAEVVRAEAKPVETPRENQKTPLPGETPAVEPNSVKMAERAQTVPRRAEQPSKLSRQNNPVVPSPSEIVNAPQTEVPSSTANKMEASVQPVERRPSAVAQAKAIQSEPQASPQQQTTQIARREPAQPTPTPQTSSPTLTRQVRQPVNTPRSAVDAPQTEAVGPNADPTTPQPSEIASRRQAAGVEATMKPSAEPAQSATVDVAQRDAARRPSSDSQPSTAKSPSPATMARAATQAPSAAANAQAIDGPATAGGSAEAKVDAPAPAAGNVARAEAGAPAASATRADMSGAEAAAAAAGAVGGSALARAVSGEQPSVSPFTAPTARVARAATAAPTAASPTNVDSPSLAQGEGTPGSEAGQGGIRSGSLAIGKASSGAVGSREPGSLGQSAEPGMAGSPQPGPVAAATANRGGNSQGGAPGPVVGTNAPAAIVKSASGGAGGRRGEVVSGADVPTTSLPAQESVAGGGGTGPGGLQASSGSAVQRGTTAGPTPGGATGPASGSDVNLGPSQVVTQLGSGKAAGGDGGGPAVRINTKGSPLARSNTGGGGLGSLASTQVAAAPAAPAGDGGGAPIGKGVAPGTNLDASAAAGVGARIGQADGLPGQLASATATGGVGQVGAASGQPAQVSGGTLSRAGAEGSGQAGTPGPVGGGGAGKIARATGQSIAGDGQAEMIELPTGTGTPVPSGTGGGQGPAGGGPPQVAGKEPVRGSAGLPGQSTGPTGAEAGEMPVATNIVGGVGAGPSTRRTDLGSDNAPSVAAVGGSGPVRKTNVAGIPSGSAEMIDLPATAGAPAATGNIATAAAQPGPTGGPSRPAGSLPVQVAAVAGPGGLVAEFSPEVGSLNRRAQRDSEIVHAGTARFLSRKVGGPLAIDGRAREPAEAFSNRSGKRLTKGSGPGLPTERTEAAVEAGLDFLARHQSPDGSWSLNNFGAGRPGYENEKAEMHSDAAATGLALLTYLGAGYDHYDDQYKHVIRAALEYLIKNQKENGDLYVPFDVESNKSAWLYTHGIASIALCEAYGMTGDENLKGPAQKAIDFIVASQNPKLGGWRYAPQFQADTSVSGWQLMALKSGELAGLKVPAETYARVKQWLDSAKGTADGSQYVYNPGAPNTTTQRHGRQASTSMTAVALLMRLYTGWNRNDPSMVKGADQLLAHLPAVGTASQPTRDTYYWYYATQVMFHMKGKHWQQWHEHLHPMLVERQVQSGPLAGSWDPKGAVPDRWAVAGGRIYVTTLNLLSLEVAYRHLPIYESTAK